MVKGLHGRPTQLVSLELETNVSSRGEFEFEVKGIIKRISHDDAVDGPFEVGETVTGGTSGETGEVIHVGSVSGSQFLIYRKTSAGDLQNVEVLTGGTSGATANSTTVPADDSHRVVVSVRKLGGQGKITVVRTDMLAKSGAAYTSWILEVLDTDDVSASVLDGPNTAFLDDTISVPASAPSKIQHLTNIGRTFVTKGTPGKIQIVVTTTGGDNTSDTTWRGQVYGEVNA